MKFNKFIFLFLILTSSFSQAVQNECDAGYPMFAKVSNGYDVNINAARCIISKGNINSYELALEFYLVAYVIAIQEDDQERINEARLYLAVARAHTYPEEMQFDLLTLYELRRIDTLAPKVAFYLGMIGYNERGKPEYVAADFMAAYEARHEWASYALALLKLDLRFDEIHELSDIDVSSEMLNLSCWLKSEEHFKFKVANSVKKLIPETDDC